MIPRKVESLIDKIFELTENGKIQWQEEGDDVFVCKTSKATISLGYAFDADEELSYYFFKYFSYNKNQDTHFRISNEYAKYELLEKLFYAASASAIGIDDEIDDFLSEFE